MNDRDFKKLVTGMVVVVDTREKKNKHITDYLDSQKIPYINEKLNSGDYSVKFPYNSEYDYCVIVERKNSLTELAGNFTSNRERFVNEFERLGDSYVHLVVESASMKKLVNGTYRSEFSPKSYMASLVTWSMRYDCPVWFSEVSESPLLIYSLLYYGVREKFRENSC